MADQLRGAGGCVRAPRCARLHHLDWLVGTTCTRYLKDYIFTCCIIIRAASEHGRGASVKVEQYCHSNVCKKGVGRGLCTPDVVQRVKIKYRTFFLLWRECLLGQAFFL